MNRVEFLTVTHLISVTVVFRYADSSFYFSAAGACGIDEHNEHDVH